MKWNRHSEVEGTHAFLSASKFHWINYDADKLVSTYTNHLATRRGTELHELAAQCIRLGQRLPRSKKTLNMYVNDAIGYKMTPEQPLFYSYNCYGTSDAISFRDKLLRIHDLKTGATPAHMEQLMVYAALFCLEYNIDPNEINFELRIYQMDEIIYFEPTAEDILPIMHQIVECDKIINNLNNQEV